MGPLRNPANDATDIAAALRGAGFDATLKLDTDGRSVVDAIRAFGATLEKNNGMGPVLFCPPWRPDRW